MFGFSLSKLLFTIAVILVVWYGFKILGRVDKQRKARLKKAAREGRAATRERADAVQDVVPDAEDMVACAACGAFVSASNARSCGRDNCPYPG